MRGIHAIALAAVVLLFAPALAAPEARPEKSLDELLREVQAGRAQEQELNRRREEEFRRRKAEQQALLSQAEAERARLEARSAELERVFQENERALAVLDEQLRGRLGSLGELFGVVRQVAGDTRSVVEGSIASAEHPGRAAPLDAIAQSRKLPTIEQLEDLWYRLQHEMTEAGKVVRFRAPVVLPDGSHEEREVVRIGVFSAISDGEFLVYQAPKEGESEGSLALMPRQPGSRFLRAADDFAEARDGREDAPIDPSKGSILGLLVQAPTARERIDQGGPVGYTIIVLGIAGGAVAVWRFFALTAVGRRVAAQAKQQHGGADNPLGRLMQVYEANPGVDTETLELRLDEAVMRELPPLERGLTTIRVISVVAPLLGLLGTVTGMIKTFQVITLFGTGDPKMMAAGIAEALVTTMLGLIVAIPLTFLHSLVSDRSKAVTEVLDEQAAGMIARRAEASAA
jgi:biopolymer transport protein ExbB